MMKLISLKLLILGIALQKLGQKLTVKISSNILILLGRNWQIELTDMRLLYQLHKKKQTMWRLKQKHLGQKNRNEKWMSVYYRKSVAHFSLYFSSQFMYNPFFNYCFAKHKFVSTAQKLYNLILISS